MDLTEKIDYERELLFLDSVRKSKEGMYTAVDEICCKKKIQRFIRSNVNHLGISQKEKLYNMDNMTESAYRYVQDYGAEQNDLDKVLCIWLSKL